MLQTVSKLQITELGCRLVVVMQELKLNSVCAYNMTKISFQTRTQDPGFPAAEMNQASQIGKTRLRKILAAIKK
jgi:hypothetical protein